MTTTNFNFMRHCIFTQYLELAQKALCKKLLDSVLFICLLMTVVANNKLQSFTANNNSRMRISYELYHFKITKCKYSKTKWGYRSWQSVKLNIQILNIFRVSEKGEQMFWAGRCIPWWLLSEGWVTASVDSVELPAWGTTAWNMNVMSKGQ